MLPQSGVTNVEMGEIWQPGVFVSRSTSKRKNPVKHGAFWVSSSGAEGSRTLDLCIANARATLRKYRKLRGETHRPPSRYPNCYPSTLIYPGLPKHFATCSTPINADGWRLNCFANDDGGKV